MKEYEISVSDKVLGKVNVFIDNIKIDLSNSLIESNDGFSFEKIDEEDYQTYEIELKVNNIDDLYDIVSLYIYENDKVFEKIEEIKNYNNIKTIKKDTNIKIVVPEIYLKKLNKSKNDIDLNSLMYSKVHFIKNTIITLNNNDMLESLNKIKNDYNNYLSNSEYEFLTDDEKKDIINKYLNRVEVIIDFIEQNTNFKYGKNYVIPIKVSNN